MSDTVTNPYLNPADALMPEGVQAGIAGERKAEAESRGRIQGLDDQIFSADTDIERTMMQGRREAAAVPRPKFQQPAFNEEGYSLKNHGALAAGILGAIAMVGSLSLKTGAVGAMEALNGAMKGYYTGNQAAYQRGLVEYSRQLDEAITKHKAEMDDYYQTVNNVNLSTQEKVSELNLKRARYGHLQQAEQKTLAGHEKNISMLYKAGEKMMELKQKHEDRTEELKQRHRERADELKMRAALPTEAANRKTYYEQYRKEKIAAGETPEEYTEWVGKEHPGKSKVSGALQVVGLPAQLKGVEGKKGADRFTDDKGKVWDWNYTTKKWEPHKA